MNEPKSYTPVIAMTITGNESITVLHFYRDARKYKLMSYACQSPETEKEYKAWWRWYRKMTKKVKFSEINTASIKKVKA